MQLQVLRNNGRSARIVGSLGALASAAFTARNDALPESLVAIALIEFALSPGTTIRPFAAMHALQEASTGDTALRYTGAGAHLVRIVTSATDIGIKKAALNAIAGLVTRGKQFVCCAVRPG